MSNLKGNPNDVEEVSIIIVKAFSIKAYILFSFKFFIPLGVSYD